MKKILLLMSFVVSVFVLSAQVAETAQEKIPKMWTVTGITGLNMSQTSLVNWSAGGENTVAANAYFNLTLLYKKNKHSWENTLSTELGATYTQARKWLKSVDKLDFASKYGYQIASKWDLGVLADFKTQFLEGYKNPGDAQYISRFLAPGYLNLALGLDYKPIEYFSLFLSPITGKMTFVNDDFLSNAGAFGVDAGKKNRFEAGSYVKAAFNKEILKNVTLMSKLDLFTAYNSSFGNVDVNWENVLGLKVNDYITATVHTNLIYDDDIKQLDSNGTVIGGPRVQFKEMIGVGLSYKF